MKDENPKQEFPNERNSDQSPETQNLTVKPPTISQPRSPDAPQQHNSHQSNMEPRKEKKGNKNKSKWTEALRHLSLIAFLISLILSLGTLGIVQLTTHAERNGVTDAGLVLIPLAPVYDSLLWIMCIGIVSGFIYFALKRAEKLSIIILFMTLILSGVSIWHFQNVEEINTRNAERDRVMFRDETLALITGCEVSDITFRPEGTIWISYFNYQDGVVRPLFADPDYYQDYVDAANTTKCDEEIRYGNANGPADPSTGGHRWISISEATELLEMCLVDKFSDSEPLIDDSDHPGGDGTGIFLVDFGYRKLMHLDSENADTLYQKAIESNADCEEDVPLIDLENTQ